MKICFMTTAIVLILMFVFFTFYFKNVQSELMFLAVCSMVLAFIPELSKYIKEVCINEDFKIVLKEANNSITEIKNIALSLTKYIIIIDKAPKGLINWRDAQYLQNEYPQELLQCLRDVKTALIDLKINEDQISFLTEYIEKRVETKPKVQ